MRCPQCRHENGEAAKFCEKCGTKLVRVCPGCGHEVSPKARFRASKKGSFCVIFFPGKWPLFSNLCNCPIP